MNIAWTRGAKRQLAAAYEYILGENARSADEVLDKILQSVRQLADFPESGRIGRVENTRELVIVSTPYIVAYRIKRNEVQVLALLHGKRRWPKSF